MENVNIKDLNKRINSIGKRSATLRDDIQTAGIMAVQAIFEEERNGDTGFITKLANSMGNGANCASFVRWIEANTPAFKKPAKPGTKNTFKVDGTDYVLGLHKGWQEIAKSDVVENLAAVKWYDMPKPESELKDFDFAKKLESLLKSAYKAQEDGRLVNAGQLRVLESLLDQQEKVAA